MSRIDTHQHFWAFAPEKYPWIDWKMAPLRRDFGPADLEPELRAAGIDGTLLVEARGHLEETENLLRIARETPFVRGVVGWLPLAEPGIEALLEHMAHAPLCGVRHWMGAADDASYMSSSALHHGVGLLQRFGLSYDLMLWPPQLASAAGFVDRHPEQHFVLDHFAKPYVARQELEAWRRDLRELARRPNVYCKVSGLATEANWESWAPSDLQPYLDAALEAFSPRRLMFGSDWPVCTLATTYRRWADTIATWAEALSVSERDRLFGETAIEAYRLKRS